MPFGMNHIQYTVSAVNGHGQQLLPASAHILETQKM